MYLKDVKALQKAIRATRARSQWDKGVKRYAVDMLNELYEINGWDRQDLLDICNIGLLEKACLLNAGTWQNYSSGAAGASLVASWDIAERLCSKSELRKLTDKDGRLADMSNNREQWHETQGRAIAQAWDLIETTCEQLQIFKK